MSDPKYKHIGAPSICLVEECGELIQAIAKGERFGWYNHHPDRSFTNLYELQAEWKDVKEAYDKLINSIVANKYIESSTKGRGGSC